MINEFDYEKLCPSELGSGPDELSKCILIVMLGSPGNDGCDGLAMAGHRTHRTHQGHVICFAKGSRLVVTSPALRSQVVRSDPDILLTHKGQSSIIAPSAL
jgi:NAD(P)H-hydrate repair Nnr-like enzyme with NAD(P)H-hydrate epimerase domain